MRFQTFSFVIPIRHTLLVCSALLLSDVRVEANPLSDAAQKTERSAGAPRASDVCFSSRWERPMGKNDSHDTFAAAKAFRATRIDWSYPSGLDFIRKVKAQKLGYFGTISAELEGSTSREGRDKSYQGRIVGNPELDFLAARGDVNSDEYRAVVLRHVKLILDGGADGIFVDDPGMTYHNAIYNKGGYGDAGMRKFPAWLEAHTTQAERSAWKLPADLKGFDYPAFVRAQNGNPAAELQAKFHEFHRQSVDEFYQWLHAEADKIAGRRVPFGCNNWSVHKQDEFPFREHFDFWLGETSVQYAQPTAKLIYEKTRTARQFGKLQCFSPPNDGDDKIPTRDLYVSLTRKIIATSYACGSATLVPWDVWRRGPDTPRFFGTLKEFGDLYSVVADHSALFEGHEEVFAAGGGIAPTAAKGVATDLVRVTGEPSALFISVRAVAGDDAAPIVVHLVDWSDQHVPLKLELKNSGFGSATDQPLALELLIPGKTPETVRGVTMRGLTTVELPALKPWGLLVCRPLRAD